MEYCRPHFSHGRPAWVYTPIAGKRKHDEIGEGSGDGGLRFATFDELLSSESFGVTSRGTGALVMKDGFWYISSYHLSFPMPNELAEKMTKVIAAWEKRGAEVVAEQQAVKLLEELALEASASVESGERRTCAKAGTAVKGKKKSKSK